MKHLLIAMGYSNRNTTNLISTHSTFEINPSLYHPVSATHARQSHYGIKNRLYPVHIASNNHLIPEIKTAFKVEMRGRTELKGYNLRCRFITGLKKILQYGFGLA
jgi:hypothetical protein